MARVIPFPDRGYEPELPILLLARELGRSQKTIERWVREGMPHTKHRGPYGNEVIRARVSEVTGWLERKAS